MCPENRTRAVRPTPRKTPDRRSERTRGALRSAFSELVLSRGYESLTTGEISRKANVGRSTFYMHYASKEELLEESLKYRSSEMAACVDGDVAPPLLKRLLDHFYERRIVNRVFFTYPIRSLWVKSLAALIEPRLPLPARTGGLRPLIPRSLAAIMIAEMQISLITHWLTGRYTLSAESVAQMLIANTRAMLSGFSSL
jgi:AcrR family transcriptional regulator